MITREVARKLLAIRNGQVWRTTSGSNRVNWDSRNNRTLNQGVIQLAGLGRYIRLRETDSRYELTPAGDEALNEWLAVPRATSRTAGS